MNSIKVKHKKSGLTYRLLPRKDIHDECYYLSCNDGKVPGGQLIHRTKEELEAMFEFIG